MNIALVLQLVSLFNAVVPGIASLIVVIRKTDGTISIATFLDEADAKFAVNITEVATYLKAHPQP